MQAKLRRRANRPSARQNGVALLILLVIVIIATTGVLLNSLNRASVATERDRITAEALAQAKEALIGYAVGVSLSASARPGDLPCPDVHTPGSLLEGTSSTPCSGNALGRLPWKTLGLPDLRDGSGERLWYAVSANFKNSPRIGTLNSDTPGTISVFASAGNILYDGGINGTGAVAVIIAPGAILQRQGASTLQDRSAAGAANPENYLDIGNGKDNANFTDGSATNGFIYGPVLGVDAEEKPIVIVNDRLITTTYQDLMPKLEKRVAGEVLKCLTDYASANSARYPWAADIGNSGNGDYRDISGLLFGRIPDTPFTRTNTDSGGGMSGTSSASCNITSGSGWWLNWKEQMFYGLADAYKPFNPPATPTVCGTCLAVNPPSATANKQVVVIVAGKRLSGVASGQPRTTGEKGNVANYLENPNQGGVAFAQGSPTSTFNDVVVYQ